MRACAALILVSCLGLLSAAACACEGKTVILDERFENRLNGWEDYPNVKVGGGEALITLSANHYSTWLFNKRYSVRDADICVTAAFPDRLTEDPSVLGLTFWSVDVRAFFVARVDTNGTVTLLRSSESGFQPLWSQPDPSVQKGPGATNTIRVVTKDDLISVSVNGSKVRDAHIPRPSGDTHFGLFVEVGKAALEPAARTFRFRSVKVTSVD